MSVARKAGIASGVVRRKKREELQALFLAAVAQGATPTRNDVISRNTYTLWCKEDPSFAARTKAAKPIKLPKKRKKSKPIVVRHVSAMEKLADNDLYRTAIKKLTGRKLSPDIREFAVQEIILQHLEGEEINVGRAIHEAKAEYSPFVGFHDTSVSMWDF